MDKLDELKSAVREAERDLEVFNILNPIIAMGSGKWNEHTRLMNRVANTRRALADAQENSS